MPALTSRVLFVGQHTGPEVVDDPNLYSADDFAAYLTNSTSISAVTSQIVSRAASGALDSAPVSTADSKGVSSGTRASIADSRAISGSTNTSVADSKASSVSVNTSIADSKATSVGFATIVPTLNGIPGFQQPFSTAVLRTANSKMAEWVSLRDFDDSAGGGVADDRATVVRANAAFPSGGLVVPPGTYRVASNLTVTCGLLLLPGAVLKPDNNVTITIAGAFTASALTCLSLANGGFIRFTSTSGTTIIPQWFGALGDSITADDQALNDFFATCVKSPRVASTIPPAIYGVNGAPTLHDASYVTMTCAGARFLLTSAATFGLQLAGTHTDVSIDGLEVVGTGVAPVGINGGATGVGTPIQSGLSGGSNLRLSNITVSGTARGIYVDSSVVDAWDTVTITKPKATNILGTFSGTGYGVVGGSCSTLRISQPQTDLTQRHAVYISVSHDVFVEGGTLKRNRSAVATGGQFGALEIARSYDVLAMGMTFDTCSDGACSIEPHESDTAAITRNIRVVACVFRGSVGPDCYIGGSGPATSSLLESVLFADNQIERVESAAATIVPIRVLHGTLVTVARNQIRAANAYTGVFTAIYLAAAGGDTYTQDCSIVDNDYDLTSGVGGLVVATEIAVALTTSATSRIAVTHRSYNVSGTGGARYCLLDGVATNPNIKILDRRGEQGIPTNRGDANATITAADAWQVLYSSALTAARTVTFTTSDMNPGRTYRVVRTGLGAGTLDVGGVKTIPAATAAFVDVTFDGTAVRLVGYGTL